MVALAAGRALPAEVEFDDFVGAGACASCHQDQYQRWASSTHGHAGGAPTRDTVVSNFDGTVLRFSDATVTLEIDAAEQFLVHVAQAGKPPQSFAVAGFVGGGHMLGGGTQTAFTAYSDGSWRLLPFDYSLHSDLWFCDVRTGSGGWRPITKDLALADCRYWPPVNNFSPNCGNCHSSQMQSAFDPGSGKEQLRFSSLAINCESCHGPGRRHVQLMSGDNAGELADIGMESLDLLSKSDSVQLCFRCHALTQQLQPGYLPGAAFNDYYSVHFFPGGRRYADGRVKGFGYQEGHLYSDCYINGGMTCVDCHDPHAQDYRDADYLPLPGKLDDGQCLDCHPSKATAVAEHTGHPVDSAGSRCVACHMPFLQHETVGKEVKFARSDHTISIPRPEWDAELGLETACAGCHPDVSPAQQQAQIESWHGRLKPQKPVVRVVQQLVTTRDPALARKALEQDYPAHPAARFDLLRWAGDILGLSYGARDAGAAARLQALSLDRDPDVAALARALLLASAGSPPAAASASGLAGDRRVGLWLSLWGRRLLDAGNRPLALPLLEQAAELHPARIPNYLALAQAQFGLGQPQVALATLRKASVSGLGTRDEMLHLLDQVCDILDALASGGMERDPATTRLCAPENRRAARPVPPRAAAMVENMP